MGENERRGGVRGSKGRGGGVLSYLEEGRVYAKQKQ